VVSHGQPFDYQFDNSAIQSSRRVVLRGSLFTLSLSALMLIAEEGRLDDGEFDGLSIHRRERRFGHWTFLLLRSGFV
jgi:hypothetical protein